MSALEKLPWLRIAVIHASHLIVLEGEQWPMSGLPAANVETTVPLLPGVCQSIRERRRLLLSCLTDGLGTTLLCFRCKFEKNSAEKGNGGAIFFDSIHKQNLTLQLVRSHIENNVAELGGTT